MILDARPLWCPEGVAPVNHWGAVAGRLWGGLQGPPTDEPILLGIRGVALFADETHEVVAKPAYDDTGVLLVPGHEPFLFPMATHPYQLHSKLAQDGDGDGVPDVATIRTGLYILTRAITKPFPIWTLTTYAGSDRIPCVRDLDHNGKIDWREDEKQNLRATAILLHVGYDAPKGSEHRSSIGCQTASLRSLEVIARAGRRMEYRLVDAAEAIQVAKFVTADTLPPENNA